MTSKVQTLEGLACQDSRSRKSMSSFQTGRIIEILGSTKPKRQTLERDYSTSHRCDLCSWFITVGTRRYRVRASLFYVIDQS